ncbi:hypothetical protein [Actinomyces trachealis]|uniref:hypothetical protein n=1 Tax=Actinomyces trachealis TaxID=2763540 RepID=UPI001892CA66|nr:hypothetical protein [Actinomyces trachealis]
MLSPFELPVSVLLALWAPFPSSFGTAVIQGSNLPHHVAAPDGATVELDQWLVQMRPLRRVMALLPSPATPLVPSPQAMEAGQAVLVSGVQDLVLVPEPQPGTLHWQVLEAAAPLPPLSSSQARRDVHQATEEAISTLLELDLARERPKLADSLNDLVTATLDPRLLPPGLESRQRSLLERSLRLGAICDLVLQDDGAANTISQANSRAQVLRPLLDAARRGVMAATDWWARLP